MYGSTVLDSAQPGPVHLTKAQNSTIRESQSATSVERANLKIYHLGAFREAVLTVGPFPWGCGFCQRGRSVFNRKPVGQGPAEEPSDSQLRKHRRAKTMVRRLALAHELCFMWSLTFAEEVKDLEDAWHRWELFRRRMKRAGLMPSRWIVVPELQMKNDRGVWHFHVICNSFVSVERLRDAWGQGHVWLKKGSAKGAGTYASKYLSKGFEENEQREEGDHRYRRALGMTLETTSVQLTEEQVEAGEQHRMMREGGYRLNASMALEDGSIWYLLERPYKMAHQGTPPHFPGPPLTGKPSAVERGSRA